MFFSPFLKKSNASDYRRQRWVKLSPVHAVPVFVFAFFFFFLQVFSEKFCENFQKEAFLQNTSELILVKINMKFLDFYFYFFPFDIKT